MLNEFKFSRFLFPMFKIKEEKILSKGELKCMVLNPLIVGGSSKEIIDSNTKAVISTNAGVNSMVLFKEGFLFGLSDGRIGYSNKNRENEYFNLHTGNICTIDVLDSMIMTGSWDKTSFILYPCENQSADLCLNEIYYKKVCLNHPESVWFVKIMDKDTFITGCADGVVRLFKNGKLIRELAHHSNAVRSFILVDKKIISIDNYGKLLKTDLNGMIEKTRNLDELCFSLCEYERLILVCGENGHVFVINSDLEILYKVKLPCNTCWSIKADNTLVYVCGSNGTCYILEKDPNFEQTEYTSEEKEDKVCDQKTPTEHHQDKEFVSEGVKYKIKDGKLFKEMNGDWELVGDVDKSYDHSFTIELEGKNYTLSFNDSDNSHEVASEFLRKNKMSQVYHQEILDYIEKNFKKKSIFKFYESINIEGIKKILGEDNLVINTLRKISSGTKISVYKEHPDNVYEIDEQIKNIPLFVKLDICKYLIFKKIPVDLSFIFRAEIKDKKEAKAFIFLMTNLVEDSPFSLKILIPKIKSLRDLGLLTLDDVSSFENNWNIKNKN